MSYNADDLIRAYINLRDAKEAVKREADERMAELGEQMEGIENALLDMLKAAGGVDSMKTKSGVAYRTVKTRYWAADWDAFKQFVEEQGDLDLLEHRIHQTNFKTFLEEHPGLVPPVNVDSRYAITVRRGNK
jgi:hypothetical protein